MAGPVSTARATVGRAVELQALLGVVEDAAAGRAGAMLITGEAGVGKTVLTQDVCERTQVRIDVVWATCLPLASLAVPLLPLTSALRRWAAEHDEPIPDLGASERGGITSPVAFDDWLDSLCTQQPVLLVVDDLHWADQSTLDVLMYVLAGNRPRRLAVIGTIRTEDVADEDPLRRWLADVRRFAGVGELTLGRLDRTSTREQMASLLGEPPHEALVDAVFTRSRGNAYLTSLLVRGLAPSATTLPADLPTELSDALAHSWHRMSVGARDTTRVIAIAGRPVLAESLAPMTAQAGIVGDVTAFLREATQAGVLVAGPGHTYWFAHPLMAEVLEEGLPPDRRRLLHGRFAEQLATDIDASSEIVDTERVIGIADHLYRSGDSAAAYEWALRGADAAERSGGYREAMRLLRRALDLLRAKDPAGTSERDLLDRIRQAGQRTGEHVIELQVTEELLQRLDHEREPLLAAELLVRRSRLRQSTGQQFGDDSHAREAARLVAGHPDSPAFALALSELARVQLWKGDARGAQTAQQALRSARASGDRRALSYALSVNVMARCFDPNEIDPDTVRDGREAQAAALDVDDIWGYLFATGWLCNATDVEYADNVIEINREAVQVLVERGAPHPYIADASVPLARGLFERGDWRGTEELLRVVFGATPSPFADVFARLVAATLSCRQGRPREADAHLLRAEEIFAERSGFLGLSFDAVTAEVALARGDPTAAISRAMSALDREGTPDKVETLVPLVARAHADQAQAARDLGQDPVQHTMALTHLRDRFPTTVEDFGLGIAYRRTVEALNAIYDAEMIRGLAAPGGVEAWQRATRLCTAAHLPWYEVYAAFRTAEASARSPETRGMASSSLRSAHRLAQQLETGPLLGDIEALARSARIPLSRQEDRPPEQVKDVPGLSRREREVLVEIVAGRTYGEIAKALFISEKTVSVHVSNMLRKTGTSNRVELAQLATRLGGQG